MILTAITRNKSVLPYNLNKDIIDLKVSVLDKRNASYLELELTLYSNFTGSDEVVGTYQTNEYGIAAIQYRTDLIVDKTIDTGLMWITFVHDSVTYTSNKTRVNFINDSGFDIQLIIIDANTPESRVTNSGAYNIYDANTPSNRANLSGDYTIVERFKLN